MGYVPPRIIPSAKYQGEVCPDCGYPMNYRESSTCGFCGTYHLLPFDSLLCGPNWKPGHPYDAVPRAAHFSAWRERVMLAIGTFLLDFGRTVASLLFQQPSDISSGYHPLITLADDAFPLAYKSPYVSPPLQGDSAAKPATVQAMKMLADTMRASAITLDAQYRPMIDQMYTVPPLSGMAGASALFIAPQISSGYTPLLDDADGIDAPMYTGNVQPDPLSAKALLNKPKRKRLSSQTRHYLTVQQRAVARRTRHRRRA